jgi:hypothetical protein
MYFSMDFIRGEKKASPEKKKYSKKKAASKPERATEGEI